MAEPIHGQLAARPVGRIAPTPSRVAASGRGFADTLAEATGRKPLNFSAHARNRLASRNIQLDAAHMERLARATDQAAARGARDSLVLMNDLGLIVNVPSRTVVTALDGERMANGVFTNIDSTVIIRD